MSDRGVWGLTSAMVPKNRAFAFPAQCVCCVEADVVRRDIETSTYHSIPVATQGYEASRSLEVDIPVRLPRVPYCPAHAAELDAHLAKQRKEIRRKEMPEPKLLADGKRARFYTPLPAHGLGGALGFQASLEADVVGSSEVEAGDLHLMFQSAEYAELFRDANGLRTISEHFDHQKQEKHERKQTEPSDLKRAFARGTFRLEKMRKKGDVAGLIEALSHKNPSMRRTAVLKLAPFKDDPRAGDWLGT